jgi:endothelin-converting enzyme/putative endopeptidase
MKKPFAALLCTAALAASAADTPLRELPYTPGLDVSAMDRSVDPCVDFYQYSCGGWMKANPIPADQASWDVYGKLAVENQRFLWGILEELASRTEGRNANQQKIGDYFAACMDEAAAERLGARPLKPYFDVINGIVAKRDLPAALAHLHLATGDNGFFFGFGSGQDFGKSTEVIAFASAGGLGLPDRDYYLKDDDKSKEIRDKYVAHVGRIFELAGDAPEAARRNAAKVMEIETALARDSLARVDRRDPYRLFHKMDLKGLQALTPGFDWTAVPAHARPRARAHLQRHRAGFLQGVRAAGRGAQARGRAHLPALAHGERGRAPALDRLRQRELRVLQQDHPRRPGAQAAVEALRRPRGHAARRGAGPGIRAAHLSAGGEGAGAAHDAPHRGGDAPGHRVPAVDGPKTKQKALEKLHAIVNKIGYPEKWRDYGTVVVKRDDFFGNVERATRFETRRDLAKIGKPLDRTEWYMTPPTVNAYFDSQLNDINFPAGVLQPPLFDPKMDDAPNYGNTGATIGHELTHGFDDQGRKFDAKGNLADWWTQEDNDAFTERAKCIADQYAQYTVIDDIKINSELTLGEDVADLGGIILAWMAWKAETAGKALEPRDGLTPEQRFFVGYAQWGCTNDRPENIRLKAITDPHSPPQYRTNGLVVNLPEFEKAFSCKPGQAMVSEKRCRVW